MFSSFSSWGNKKEKKKIPAESLTAWQKICTTNPSLNLDKETFPTPEVFFQTFRAMLANVLQPKEQTHTIYSDTDYANNIGEHLQNIANMNSQLMSSMGALIDSKNNILFSIQGDATEQLASRALPFIIILGNFYETFEIGWTSYYQGLRIYKGKIQVLYIELPIMLKAYSDNKVPTDTPTLAITKPTPQPEQKFNHTETHDNFIILEENTTRKEANPAESSQTEEDKGEGVVEEKNTPIEALPNSTPNSNDEAPIQQTQVDTKLNETSDEDEKQSTKKEESPIEETVVIEESSNAPAEENPEDYANQTPDYRENAQSGLQSLDEIPKQESPIEETVVLEESSKAPVEENPKDSANQTSDYRENAQSGLQSLDEIPKQESSTEEELVIPTEERHDESNANETKNQSNFTVTIEDYESADDSENNYKSNSDAISLNLDFDKVDSSNTTSEFHEGTQTTPLAQTENITPPKDDEKEHNNTTEDEYITSVKALFVNADDSSDSEFSSELEFYQPNKKDHSQTVRYVGDPATYQYSQHDTKPEQPKEQTFLQKHKGKMIGIAVGLGILALGITLPATGVFALMALSSYAATIIFYCCCVCNCRSGKCTNWLFSR